MAGAALHGPLAKLAGLNTPGEIHVLPTFHKGFKSARPAVAWNVGLVAGETGLIFQRRGHTKDLQGREFARDRLESQAARNECHFGSK